MNSIKTFVAACVGVGLATSGYMGHAADAVQKPLPVALVDALNTLSGGPHKGFRANHAKGILADGFFAPAPSATSVSKAPHFAKSVPVIVRFSDTTGVPTLPDAYPQASPHGIAIRFKLPDDSKTDIVAISANGFPVATPEDFLALLQAIAKSDEKAPKPTALDGFLGAHPAAAKFVSTPRPAPVSFATIAFFGVNAFKFTNAKGVSHFIRYQIIPDAGEHELSDEQAKIADQNYLMTELPQRIEKAPVVFKLYAQVAEQGDSTVDATQVWPSTRKRVLLGTLNFTHIAEEQINAQRQLLFNPLALEPGIEASADPILAARPPAYGVSYAQRAQ